MRDESRNENSGDEQLQVGGGKKDVEKKILGEAQLKRSMHEIAFIKLVTLFTN